MTTGHWRGHRVGLVASRVKEDFVTGMVMKVQTVSGLCFFVDDEVVKRVGNFKAEAIKGWKRAPG